MQKSADSKESADSLRGNRDLASEQVHSKLIKQEIQSIDDALEQELKDVPDSYINSRNLHVFLNENYSNDPNALKISQEYLAKQNVFGIKVTRGKLKEMLDRELAETSELSTEDRIKDFTESIRSGKSTPEILKSLIAEFESEEAVQTWVENWRKFLRLSEFAETKSPTERKVINRIIGSADFSSETAFQSSLDSITNSSEISAQTKLEISLEFNGSNVSSVDELDSGLKYMKSRKAEFESALDTRNLLKDSLSSDIDDLQEQLDEMQLGDPKRKEVEEKISEKKKVLRQTKSEIIRLESEKPSDVSYSLRNGFSAILSPNGSRSVLIEKFHFSIKLPSTFLPFMGAKNLRCINLAFPCSALMEQGISNEIFVPNLENGSVPTKSQRDMGHLILSSLGFNDSRILSEKEVKQVHDDIGRLINSGDLRTGQECLSDLGIYDPIAQSTDSEQLKKALRFIKENRDVRDEVFFGRLEGFMNHS